MRRRTILTGALTAAAGLALMTGLAVAQQPAEIDAIKSANSSFYAALSARDAMAMGGLWANKPYVVNIGPRSKTIDVGYANAVTKWMAEVSEVFTELKASMTSTAQIQTDGKVAWVVGTEHAEGKNKAGTPFAFDTFVTNIYEKDGDRWLMVSHHAGIQPK